MKKSKYKLFLIFMISISFVIIINIVFKQARQHNKELAKNNEIIHKTIPTSNTKKKIIYIDSYNKGYEWSDSLLKGILDTLNTNDLENPYELKIIHLDTKNNKNIKYMKGISLKTKKIIDSWKPDLIIASDDNASKYLILPYFKDSNIPVVFCGINAQLSEYGYPFENTTGLLEKNSFDQLFSTLKKNSNGNKIGILAPNTPTAKSILSNLSNSEYIKDLSFEFVDSFEEWKKEFLYFQKSVDSLVLINNAGISNFSMSQAKKIVNNNIKIPTGSTVKWMSPLSVFLFSKSAYEQGVGAANYSIEILDGKSPKDIPIAVNKNLEIFLNFELAEKLNIEFQESLINLSSSCTYDIYSEEEISKKNFEGITLNVLSPSNEIMGNAVKLHARQFEYLTGAKIIVHQTPFSELYKETLFGLKHDKYDLLINSSLWLPDTYNYLESLPEKMIQSKQFCDVLDYYKKISKWNNKYFLVPIDGDRHYFKYRTDVFKNKTLKKEYEEKFQKKFKVPKTWVELNEIASFITNKKIAGKTIYGISEITSKDDLLFSQFIKRAAPYVKQPNISDGIYFDSETMEPLINSPGFLKALEDFVESQKSYPPKGMNFSLADVVNSFGKGESCFSDDWDDSFIKSMELNSSIRTKVKTSISLGSRDVWNNKEKIWNHFPDVNFAPYIAWGWTSSVSKNSLHKEAAFNFLGFFSNKKNHDLDLLVGSYGVNPFRKSDFNKEFWIKKANWNENIASSYINTLSQVHNSKNKIFDLRIKHSQEYMDILSIGVARALLGYSSPKIALDVVYKRWNELNKKYGIENQKKSYQNRLQ